MGTLDRELKELAATKGQNFAYLVNKYIYRNDQIPEKTLRKAVQQKKSEIEILCLMNERVCKKAGLEEMALSWKSLATLGQEILDAKRKIQKA